jgi:hypothetical protein
MSIDQLLQRVTPTVYGWIVKETPTHIIEVHRMLVNFRIVRIPKGRPWEFDRGYCYAGTGPVSFMTAALAALAWDGGDDADPEGWIKNVMTGERNPPDPFEEARRKKVNE